MTPGDVAPSAHPDHDEGPVTDGHGALVAGGTG